MSVKITRNGFTAEQYEFLREMAYRKDCPVQIIVREAVDYFISALDESEEQTESNIVEISTAKKEEESYLTREEWPEIRNHVRRYSRYLSRTEASFIDSDDNKKGLLTDPQWFWLQRIFFKLEIEWQEEYFDHRDDEQLSISVEKV